MNYLDIIIVILLIIGAVRGFRKGMIIELATLAGLIIGIFLGVLIADIIGLIIVGIIDVNIIAIKIISFIIIFAIVLLVLYTLAKIIERLLKMIFLNIFNRIGGIFIGALKTAFILSVILIFVNMLNKRIEFISEAQRESSLLYNPVSKFAPALLPDKDFLQKGIVKTEKVIDDNFKLN